MKIKDTLIVILSDMHSGGSTALAPGKLWRFDTDRNHTPTKKGLEVFDLFMECAEYVKKNRKDKRVIIVHNGDAIEGYHHNTTQVLTPNNKEQREMHEDLMDTFMRAAGFDRRKGDELYYVNGTETHTGLHEKEIAKSLNAVPADNGEPVHETLKLNVNGRVVWFFHHGKKRGGGANEGNALRNYLREIYYHLNNRKQDVPDVCVSSHTHGMSWATFEVRQEDDFIQMHGIITPSWQRKTRYGHTVAPIDVNEIGATFLHISAAGDIRKPHFVFKMFDA